MALYPRALATLGIGGHGGRVAQSGAGQGEPQETGVRLGRTSLAWGGSWWHGHTHTPGDGGAAAAARWQQPSDPAEERASTGEGEAKEE